MCNKLIFLIYIPNKLLPCFTLPTSIYLYIILPAYTTFPLYIPAFMLAACLLFLYLTNCQQDDIYTACILHILKNERAMW
jgi:hypothetical protein